MKGYRSHGIRKQKLIGKLFQYLQIAARSGINIDYLLKDYIGVRNFHKVRTKEISGIISEIRVFLKSSGIDCSVLPRNKR